MIRPMEEHDALQVQNMMRVFYHSPMVHTDGSEDIYKEDIARCVSNDPYLEGYVFEEDGVLTGYAMVAKSFSTEFGRPCMWIEDIYITETYRGCGLGQSFLEFLSRQYPNSILRLEVEDDNTHAVHVYEKSGFRVMPYKEMYKLT